jgi:hypothetical protein
MTTAVKYVLIICAANLAVQAVVQSAHDQAVRFVFALWA